MQPPPKWMQKMFLQNFERMEWKRETCHTRKRRKWPTNSCDWRAAVHEHITFSILSCCTFDTIHVDLVIYFFCEGSKEETGPNLHAALTLRICIRSPFFFLPACHQVYCLSRAGITFHPKSSKVPQSFPRFLNRIIWGARWIPSVPVSRQFFPYRLI